MTTPRTEAGRWMLRNMTEVERVYNLPANGVDSRIRAIEDEAARKERERIASAVSALPCTIDCKGPPNDHPVKRSAVLAAITDTGEETAVEYARRYNRRAGVDTGEETAP